MELHILGPLEVWSHGRRVGLGGARAHKLLAALALEADRTVPLARLVDVLWDDDPPATAARQARNIAGALRRLLGAVITDGPGYRLRSAELPVDAQQFADYRTMARDAVGAGDPGKAVEWLRAALTLWRGPALAGIGSRALAAAAVELDERRLETIEQCVELELSLGRHAALIAELSTLVAAHPLRERFTALFMLALYRNGRAGEALDAYRALRTHLAAELGIDPGRELERLHSAILRSDPSLDLPGPLATPRQLPADTTPFVGRLTPLTELDALWPPENAATAVVIAAIDGTAGIGKTALAVHFAHRVADRFPDGQLYVNLRGFDADAEPLSAEAALGQLLRGLGADPRRMPTELDERAANYRTMLAGRRILVLLDNAASSEQVLPLLPGSATSLLIVTSRGRLSGLVIRHGARRITLDLLSQAESMELLGRTAGSGRVDREPAAAVELVDMSARLPLALRIVGERASRRVEPAPLAALAAELRAERDRLGALHSPDDRDSNLRTVLSASYRALDPATARAFRLLGLHPGADIGLAAAAAVTGLSTSDARDRLAALTAANLLTEPVAGRFTWHDLLRAYAARLAWIDDTHDALRRLLDFYLHTAHEAHLRLRRLGGEIPIEPLSAGVQPLTFGTRREAVDWCESERDNLVAIVRCAAVHGFPAHAWQLPCLLWEFYYLRKHRTEWITTHEIGLTAARAAGDRFGEGRILIGLGSAHGDQGEYPAALRHYDELLEIVDQTGDHFGKALALHNIGVAHRRLGHYDTALDYFHRVLTVEREIGERNGEGIVLSNIGECHRALGRFDEALDHYRAALTLHRSKAEPRGEANALHGIAECHRGRGELTVALARFGEALAIRRTTSDQWGTATTLHAMGHTHLAAGNSDQARKLWQEAWTLFAELADPKADELREQLSGLSCPNGAR